MSAVRIMVGGREYEVACDDGQENHLRSLARRLDERVRMLGLGLGKQPGDAYIMLLAGIMLTDELQDSTQELAHLRNDIHHSSHSFEQNKQIELENAVAATIHDIAERIELIAGELERA